MSSTGRLSDRVENDAYYSPWWAVYLFLSFVEIRGHRFLEPGAGQGNIIKAVNECRAMAGKRPAIWDAAELDPSSAAVLRPLCRTVHEGDFLTAGPLLRTDYDAVIGNPAYSIALETIQHSLERAPLVAVLLQAGFIGGAERGAWLREHMPDRYTLPHRVTYVVRARWNEAAERFDRTSTDSVPSEWMVFHRKKRRVGRCAVLGEMAAEVRSIEAEMAPVIYERPSGGRMERIPPQDLSLYLQRERERKQRRRR